MTRRTLGRGGSAEAAAQPTRKARQQSAVRVMADAPGRATAIGYPADRATSTAQGGRNRFFSSAPGPREMHFTLLWYEMKCIQRFFSFCFASNSLMYFSGSSLNASRQPLHTH